MADELQRALLLRDLELMGQPRNPNAVQPGRAGLLDLGVGLQERLGLLNQMFNPVEAIGGSMRAGREMMAPNASGYERMASLGNMLSGVAGVVAPVAAGVRAGVPAATSLMESLLGGSPAQQAAGDMARQFGVDESGALKLYHGSPHDFDRFSMSKIGTGEGAQAYGHGLYFAEAEDIAKSYRDQLANGWRLEVRDPIREAGLSGRDLDSASQMLSTSYSGDAAATDWENWTGKTLTPEQREAFTEAFQRKGGRMYEVNVNANPEDFINFDAPFEQQPPNVQKHFAYLARGGSKPTGEDLARRMESNIYIQEAAQAGIPGIRYLDAGSRGAGDGSRNYVIFDENLINIVRKYGIAGAAAMLGVSALDVERAMAQGQQQPQGLLSGAQ